VPPKHAKEKKDTLIAAPFARLLAENAFKLKKVDFLAGPVLV
jgi:hypothetical protein